MRLISRWQNSAGERVRIALRLKGIDYTYIPVSSLEHGQFSELNPQGLLPALDVGGRIIAQSAAILDYLETTFPEPSLLPADPVTRAQAKAFAALVSSEMHSLTVQRVRRFLTNEYGVDDKGVECWVHHWLTLGLEALEATLKQRAVHSVFAFGDRPGWADLHLIPQLSAARRLQCDLSPYPQLLEVEQHCVVLDAFRMSRPEAQPDFPSSP
ncbi:maleylacetoacetate isomerase [Rhizobium sp. 1399]|uniref:maleylacetoacetate isomerase n=1 Tax=Rhizobium sp. 1399 TaxID=2817758 RepID=UPI00285449A0|nr:maleylacetoacetate isomerase [Rhizobium sp. 1399]MDR6667695.1 maleylacetoacetate isomerase [Rhizobium sp. 1399]